MAAVSATDVCKKFGEIAAVDGVSLAVRDGEFMVLLGPSGCGKTTFLRIIAGLEQPSAGEIAIGGAVVNDLPPRARGIAMVFQSYGLYPHFSVRDNIAFPLKTQRTPRSQIAAKVAWAAGLLGLKPLLDRRPRQLSGGERQRVALARALVRDPSVFLLDEPLSNLDAQLRAAARNEIKQFQQRVGTTTIYVTHDQVEAMGMGDRIAVIDHGKVRQVGTPAAIYDDPADRFVATFLGSPPMNLIAWDEGHLGFRPEHFLPRATIQNGAEVTEFPFRILRTEYLGSERIVYGEIEGVASSPEATAKLAPAHAPQDGIRPGERHLFAVRNSELRYFGRDGRRARRH
jgi:multiple sugar transport system ATP-binding protein